MDAEQSVESVFVEAAGVESIGRISDQTHSRASQLRECLLRLGGNGLGQRRLGGENGLRSG